MSDQADDAVQGTLFQGSDGSIYFIPHDKLDEFRVPDENAVGVREALDQIDGEVAGFGFLKEQLRSDVRQLKAFEGPLGLPGPQRVSNTGDTIWQG